MDKKMAILGRALTNGMSKAKLQKLSGMSSATFDRRMADPDALTIAELRRLDQLAHFEDGMLLNLIRSK